MKSTSSFHGYHDIFRPLLSFAITRFALECRVCRTFRAGEFTIHFCRERETGSSLAFRKSGGDVPDLARAAKARRTSRRDRRRVKRTGEETGVRLLASFLRSDARLFCLRSSCGTMLSLLSPQGQHEMSMLPSDNSILSNISISTYNSVRDLESDFIFKVSYNKFAVSSVLPHGHGIYHI